MSDPIGRLGKEKKCAPFAPMRLCVFFAAMASIYRVDGSKIAVKSPRR